MLCSCEFMTANRSSTFGLKTYHDKYVNKPAVIDVDSLIGLDCSCDVAMQVAHQS